MAFLLKNEAFPVRNEAFPVGNVAFLLGNEPFPVGNKAFERAKVPFQARKPHFEFLAMIYEVPNHEEREEHEKTVKPYHRHTVLLSHRPTVPLDAYVPYSQYLMKKVRKRPCWQSNGVYNCW